MVIFYDKLKNNNKNNLLITFLNKNILYLKIFIYDKISNLLSK